MHVELDEITEKLVDMLVEHERQAPEEPDNEQHVLEEIRLIARRRDDWEREYTALRMLVGARLVNQVVDEYPDAV